MSESTTGAVSNLQYAGWKRLASEALDIQGACNLLGLSKAFARVVDEVATILRAAGEPAGTSDVNQHPIVQMWASKIADLSRCDYEGRLSRAIDWCENARNFQG